MRAASSLHAPVAILGGVRIPFGRSHGAYAGETNRSLLGAALRALVQRFDLGGRQVGEVVGGAVIKHARDWNLVRAVNEQWDRQGGKPDRGFLLRLARAELESESYWAATAAADRMLLHWPGDEAAANIRAAAVERLRKQADSLLPPAPKP